MTEKQCNTCRKTKPLQAFTKNKQCRDGHAGQCKQCRNAYKKVWRQADPTRTLAAERRLNLRRYGLRVADYDKMAADQGGVCAICGQPETQRRGGKVLPLVVDHDHETAEIRGLLCNSCNRGLGCFRDDPGRLKKAATYLEEVAEPAPAENLYVKQ